MSVIDFPGPKRELQDILRELREYVDAGTVRYLQIALIDTDGHTLAVYGGQATLIERLGLLRICEDTQLSAELNTAD